MTHRAALLALALAALGGCGFTPLHATGARGGSGPAIGPIFVDEVPGKAGFALQADLAERFGAERGQGPGRRLAIKLDEQVIGLGLRVDESATRSDIVLVAEYTLYEPDGTVAFTGRERATASYDIPASAFGEIAAQDDARERAAEVLAERLRAEIAIRLASRRSQ